MTLRVGIAGLGTIGSAVAQVLNGGIPDMILSAVCSGRQEKATARLNELGLNVPIVAADELSDVADIIVECAPTAAFMDIVAPALRKGRTVVTVSGAAILDHPEVIDLAATHGGRIVLATGALLGLDAIRAASEGTIHEVRMVTRKPPTSLMKAKYVVENGIDLTALDAPLKLFSGNAREGVRAFPSNVNVAAAVGLAGLGPDRTQLEIWADPGKTRNCHRIEVNADSARFTLEIENVPTEENPGTGRITALSLVAALRDLVSPLRVGS